MASSLLATAACDGTVLIWDLEKKAVKISLDPLPEPVSDVCVCLCVRRRVCVCCDKKSLHRTWQLFAMAWSHDGTLLATVCRDQRIRIYNPRESTSPTHVSPCAAECVHTLRLCLAMAVYCDVSAYSLCISVLWGIFLSFTGGGGYRRNTWS